MDAAALMPTPIAHDRPAQGEAHELLASQRVLLLMRIAGVIVLVAADRAMYRGKLEGAGRVVLASGSTSTLKRDPLPGPDGEPEALATPA